MAGATVLRMSTTTGPGYPAPTQVAHAPASRPGPQRAESWRRAGNLAAVTTAVLTSLVATSFAAPSPDDDAGMAYAILGTLVGLGVAVSLVWRRRYPVRLALAASAATLLLPLDAFPALLLLTWVLASAPRRTCAWVGGVVAAATGVALLRDAMREPADRVLSSRDAVTGALSYAGPAAYWTLWVLLLAVAVAVGLWRRQSGVAAAATAASRAQRATTARLRAEMSRQEERELIAREVHDTVAHHISLISLQATALEVDHASSGPAVQAAARQMRSSAQQAIGEMRGLVETLRTGAEGSLPGATLEDLATLLDGLRRQGRWFTSTVYVSDAHEASPALTRAVFRIVQECATNAMKHAPGQPVEVEVRAGRASGVLVRVANPLAPPSAAAPGARAGLVGMRERARQLGGTLDAGTHDGWFVVTAHLPWVTGR